MTERHVPPLKKTKPRKYENERSPRSKIGIFLSYPRQKKSEATKVAQRLARLGFQVWKDTEELKPAQEWDDEIRAAIESKQVFIAFLSERTEPERYQHKEFEFARSKFYRLPRQPFRIIPILLEDSTPLGILAPFQALKWIDLFDEKSVEWKNFVAAIDGPVDLPSIVPGTADWPRLDPGNTTFPPRPDKAVSFADRGAYALLKEAFSAGDTAVMKEALHSLSPALASVQIWLQWFLWYDDIRVRKLGWGTVAAEIEANIAEIPATPAEFAEECAAVAESIAKCWHKSLDESLGRFRGELGQAIAADVLVAETQELLMSPWPALVPAAEILSKPPALRTRIETYRTKLKSCLEFPVQPTSYEKLTARAVPPNSDDLVVWQHRAGLFLAVRQLADLLTESTKWGAAEEARRLSRDLFFLPIRVSEVPTQDDLEEALALRDRWELALRSLVTSAADRDRWIQNLHEAARVFPAAKEQAAFCSRWLSAQRDYDALESASDRLWPESLPPVAEYTAVLRLLGETILKPLQEQGQAWAGEVMAKNLRLVASLSEAELAWNWLNELQTGEGLTSALVAPTPDCKGLAESLAELALELDSVPSLRKCCDAECNLDDTLWIDQGSLVRCLHKAAQVESELKDLTERVRLLRAYSSPALEGFIANLELAVEFRRLWSEYERDLQSDDLESACGNLDQLENRLHPLPELMAITGLLRQAKAACRAKEDGFVFSWQKTRAQVNKVGSELKEYLKALPSIAPDCLPAKIQKALTALDSLDRDLEGISDIEERTRAAVNLIETDVAQAAQQLESLDQEIGSGLPGLLHEDVRLWRAAADALAAMPKPDEADLDATLQPDLHTGFPRNEESLAAEKERLAGVHEAAKRARDLVLAANKGRNFRSAAGDADVVLDASESALADLQLLSDYASCLARVKVAVGCEDWRSARIEMGSFDPGRFQESWAKVHTAINIGNEAASFPEERNRFQFLKRFCLDHPFLASIRREYESMARKDREQWERLQAAVQQISVMPQLAFFRAADLIRTPVPGERSALADLKALLARRGGGGTARREELLRAAGRNRSALLAAIGDVSGTAREVKTSTDFIPHNIVVAVLCHISEQRNLPAEVGAALGACALARHSSAYQKLLTNALGRELPDLRDLPAELERTFTAAGIAWGKDSDPESLALLFQTEMWATMEIANSPAAQSLPQPMGPSLVDFYDLRDRLVLGLRANSSVRSWYGPLAPAEALLRCGHPRQAKSILPQATAIPTLAAECSFYSMLESPAQALRDDLDALRLKCSLFEFRQMHVPQDGPLEEFGTTLTLVCRELAELGAKPESICGEISRLFDEYSRLPDDERLEIAYKTMSETMAIVEHDKALKTWSRHLKSKRGALSLRIILNKPDWAPDGIDGAFPELTGLADETVLDNPKDPVANIVRQAIRILKVKRQGSDAFQGQREALRKSLERLHSRAADEKWGYENLEMIKQLIELVEHSGDFERWLRDRSRSPQKGKSV